MEKSDSRHNLLRDLPGVDTLLNAIRSEPAHAGTPHSVLAESCRQVISDLRDALLNTPDAVTPDHLTMESMLHRIRREVTGRMRHNLAPLVNATGVVVHTNLGRSRLAEEALSNLARIAERYSNLEYDLSAGKRGSRYSAIEEILCEISGAEAGMAVNNNAGAVLLCLQTLSAGKEAIVSRGELVEIGGAFRIPDIMARSGAILREVGTTNRTHLRDYQNAISGETGLLLKVHQSNYRIEGFTAEVSLHDLVALGTEHQIPVMEDLGSGTFIDFTPYGIRREPTVQSSVACGTDVVTFSGDKLLGGPQAGLIVGKKAALDAIKRNPLTRALRIDKLTLAALESTLRLYRDPKSALTRIPTLRLITRPIGEMESLARRAKEMLDSIPDDRLQTRILDLFSRVGGGALPQQALPSKGVGIHISGMPENEIERQLRYQTPAVIGRIENGMFLMDMRTVETDELPYLKPAFETLLDRGRP